jgi:hypothetical protein
MTSATSTTARPLAESAPDAVLPFAGAGKLFTSLVGLTALLVLLQGAFAGVFLEHDGRRDRSASWIDAHAMGAHAATLLALLAAVVAIVKLRARRPLVVGSVVLALLLLLESFLGGLIRDERADTLTAVHVPLAMAIMAVTVWLSLKAVQLRRRRT